MRRILKPASSICTAILLLEDGTCWECRSLTPWASSSGTDHASPYTYDTHVPLAFYGLPFQPGTYRSHAEPVDLAATLASLLGINAPSHRDRTRSDRSLAAAGARRVSNPAHGSEREERSTRVEGRGFQQGAMPDSSGKDLSRICLGRCCAKRDLPVAGASR